MPRQNSLHSVKMTDLDSKPEKKFVFSGGNEFAVVLVLLSTGIVRSHRLVYQKEIYRLSLQVLVHIDIIHKYSNMK